MLDQDIESYSDFRLILSCQNGDDYAVAHPSNMEDHDCIYLKGRIYFICHLGAWITVL